ncbi:hypothetical protein BDZ91DRAFT_785581, partial [Kalaharituber pfeilii]
MSGQSQARNTISFDSRIFRDALSNFQNGLSPVQAQGFANTTLEALQRCIGDIQTEQMRCNNKGPMKFLLQVTSKYLNCFDIILDEYEHLGECLPQFQQYHSLFLGNSYMRTELGLVYQDILEFHGRVLKLVQRPAWTLIFRAAWKDLAMPLEQIRAKLSRHKGLVEGQASLIEFEEAKLARELAKRAFDRAEKEDSRRHKVEITNWLAAADSKSDQEHFESLRKEYPGTGSWILNDRHMKCWLNCSNFTNTELWLFGIPGAGKTILTSVIVQYLEKIGQSTPSAGAIPVAVAYFYCRYRTENKDSFNAVGRGILSQLIKHNEGIISLLWEKMADSGEITLKASNLLLELLEVAMKNSKTSYVIIDGLDECEKTERRKIISTLQSISESINQQVPGTIRLLFISTNEPDIRRQLSSIVKIQLKPNDDDIRQYTTVWTAKIQKRFRLSDAETDNIIAKVLERAQGMLLYCALVLKNLHDQGTRAQLEQELRPETLPIGLEKAYERIVVRIYSTNNVQRRNAGRILDLLACSRRPLKKHEIQAVFAIEMKDRTVDFEQRSMIDDIGDICGSLIEVNTDGAIQFVHMTARFFLTERNLIDLVSAELNLAILCTTYLTFDCFDSLLPETEIRKFVLEGYFSFQDYAAVYWFDHVEACCSKLSGDPEQAKVVGSLQSFLQKQLNTESKEWGEITITGAIKRRFRNLNDYPEVYQVMTRLASGAIQLRGATQMKAGSLGQFMLGFLHLRGQIAKARLELEKFDSLAPESRSKLEQAYGTHLFKCSRSTCTYFSEGFASSQARDRHGSRHERLFFCKEIGCLIADFGCCTLRELQAHIEKTHSTNTQTTDFRAVGFPAFHKARESKANSDPKVPDDTKAQFADLASKG